MKNLLAALVGAGALALTAAGAAGAATGTATIQPKPIVQDAAHLEFTLPAGYAQVVGAMAGTPAIGTFRRQLPSCNVDLTVGSHITAARPVRRGTRLTFPRAPGQVTTQPALRLRRAQRAGDATLYLGEPVARMVDPRIPVRAVAVMRAPRDLATKRARWLVVTASSVLWFCSAEQEREVARRLASDVWQAVRTARVAEGKAEPAAGVPRVSA